MAIAALITWLITAVGGFWMLGVWISRGGNRQPRTSHFPPGLIFGHFLLAAIGLILWIIYVFSDTTALAWIAFVLLLPVAVMGFTMLARWLPTHRSGTRDMAGTTGMTSSTSEMTASATSPAEGHFPVPVVVGHGIFAVATVILVFLAAVGVGGS